MIKWNEYINDAKEDCPWLKEDIEASIILPIFMFMFMTLYSVVNICFAEIKVQNALNNAARQICEYSYIYSFSGAKQKNSKMVDMCNKLCYNVTKARQARL